MMTPMIHYITHWYPELHGPRRCELSQTIGIQLCDPHIISVSLVANKDRPSFAQLASYGRVEDGVINVLMNTDCYIDPCDMPLLQGIGPKDVWCLSRVDNCYACSQDVWVWRGTLEVPQATYALGILGCDSRFAYDCATTGRIPSNPALSIKVHHTHASGRRTYTEQSRLKLPYLFLKPTLLGEAPVLMLRGGGPVERDRVAHLKPYYGDIKV